MGVPGLIAEVVPGHDPAALPVDHAGMTVIPFESCLRLVARIPVGRLAFATAGEIVVLPVNHVLDGLTVAFQTAPGSKLTAAEEASVVAFEVDEYDAATREGWSVVVNGRAEVVTDPEVLARLEAVGLRPWADRVERPQWVRIHPTSVTGRAIVHGP